MATAELGELTITFKADDGHVRTVVRDLERSFTRTEANMTSSATGMLAAFGRMTAGLVSVAAAFKAAQTAMHAFQAVADRGEALNKLSQSTGIAVENLSGMAHAAELADVSLEQFAASMTRLNRAMSEAARAGSDSALAFSALNVRLREAGELRNTADVLGDIADRFSGLRDGAEKTAIAVALFGRAGAQLIPFLNQGRAGLAEAAAEAKRLGIAFSAEEAAKFEAYNDQVKKLGAAFQGLVREMTPAPEKITAVVEALTNMLRAVREGAASLNNISPAQETANLTTRIGTINTEIERLNERFRRGRVDTEQYNMQLAQLNQRLANAQARMQEVNDPRNQIGPWQTTVRDERPAAPNLEAMKTAFEEAMQRIEDRMRGMPALFQDVFSEENMVRPFLQGMARIEQAQKDGVISAQRAAQMKIALQRQEQQAILDTASMAAQAITSLFPKSKAAAIAAAGINTAVGITKALSEVPWPLNWVQAGLVAASGAAQIAAIRSSSSSGGGVAAPSVGGGAAPAGGEATGGGQQNTLLVQGIQPGQLLSGDLVRELIVKIQDAQRDGYRVVVSPQ